LTPPKVQVRQLLGKQIIFLGYCSARFAIALARRAEKVDQPKLWVGLTKTPKYGILNNPEYKGFCFKLK